MILEHIAALNQKKIILASASPRRAELLRQVGLRNFEIVPSKFAEDLEKGAYGGPAGYAQETARRKAVDVTETLCSKGNRPDLVISADTVVEVDGLVLEKPGDAKEAESMLHRMSGKRHWVHTGFTLLVPASTRADTGTLHPILRDGPQLQSGVTTTAVEFDTLTDAAVQAYISSGEPFDKAGGYGVQGPAGLWIKEIQGCYFNVMGLPLHDLAAKLKQHLDSGYLS